MKSLRRVLPYIWPQWPRLVVIVSSAIFNSVLFSTTVASIIPVLTIMMGQEGLHGWVDRIITTRQYDVKFYVASKEDLAADPNMNYHLRVVEAKAKGAAAAAGIAVSDTIVAVRSPADANTAPMPTADMLAMLASTQAKTGLAVDILPAGAATSSRKTIRLIADKRPLYANYMLKAVSIMPRSEGQKSREQAVLFLMVVLTSVTFLRCFCRFLQDYIGDKVVQNSLAQLRERTYGHVLNMPVGFFAKEGGTDTVSRMVQDTGAIGGGLKTILTKAIREPLMAMSMMAWAFWLSPKLTLVFLCAAPMLVIAVSNLGRKIKRATKRSLQNWAIVLGKLAESIAAIKVVKIYNRQEYEYARFTEINRKQLKHQLRIAKTDAATDPMMEALGMIALGGGIVYGAHWAMAAGDTNTFFGVLFLLGASAEAIRRTSDVWNRLNQSNAAAERVFALIDQPDEQEKPAVGELKQFKNTIEFKNVRFTYPGTEREVLKGIDLTVQTGQNVAVVGPNGSGKTTLVNLLPRFYDVDGGAVCIDGVDVRDVTLASLRNQMAMVTQNVITFNDTIAANIAYGKPDATMDEIIEAAKRAYAHEFIAPLPDGYDSIIGEQGSGLSGGQLQRIVIARAILKNPPIMIFDEAMSQIDADSEAKIHRALDEFMKNRTAFVIAHRFSTVIKAHKIVVMNDGRIIAEGVHSELVKTCPLYQNLYQTQLLKD